MKLLRYGPVGAEKPGCLDADGAIRDLSSVTGDFMGNAVSLRAIASLKTVDLASLPLVEADVRLGAALADVPNFYCIGQNYAKHALESGAEPPTEPILFNKSSTALSGPNDTVILPKDTTKGDWEVELGVVIGTDVSYVSEAEALDCVSAYCVVNDVSERAFQLERGGTWTKGKSAPTFGPVGPWLVTADEVADPQALSLWLKLNGQTMQSSNTSDMIFGVAEIISYMSRFMALKAGDIIATGTPEGVGMGQKPQRFLQEGDEMELGIDGLGVQKQAVVALAS
ncbi:MAG: fumarylacetoacetate hydrolase family protein [Pseudomonadota bacterium]